MTACPSCGASAPATAEWCGQCYQRLGVPVAATGAAIAAAAPTQPAAAQSRFGLPPVPEGIPQQTYRPGSHAPTGWAPPTPPPAEPARTGQLGAWGWGSTGFTVIGAILLGAIMQLVIFIVTERGTIETETFVRYAIVATIAFYAVVSVIVLRKLHVGSVRLYWTDGNPALGLAIGLIVGMTLGLLGIGLNSAISGHLATDPNATLLVSEGAAGYILATVLITMIAAPLVEETLFRGLFAESLRPKGTATAIWLSAVAFAAWHLSPEGLRYYALMGALFGWLYWKRGLVCSIAAHASFNGVLTVVAIFLALTPGTTISQNSMSVSAPSGWHGVGAGRAPDNLLALDGPSGSAFIARPHLTVGAGSVDVVEIARQLQSGVLQAPESGLEFDETPVATMDLPIGPAARIAMTFQGHPGEIVIVATPTRIIEIDFFSEGSTKARKDFPEILRSFQSS